MHPARLALVLRPRPFVLVVLVLAAFVTSGLLLRIPPPRAQAATAAHMEHGMSDARMQQWVRDWYAQHPPRPSAVASVGAPVDTILATGTRFDADHNPATLVDSVHIFTGQSVMWQWVDGTHTTTSGTGSGDPLAGMSWDIPLMSTSPTFTRVFGQAGTFPFFCRVHEFFNMRGAVIVSAPAAIFDAAGTAFDTDGNPGTQVDTVFIAPGQAVQWQWLSGVHTVTNGTGSTDPNVGKLFDVPLDSSSPVFTFTFNQLGAFPFFCRQHESFNMRGVVVVTNQLSVQPTGDGLGALGFAAPMEPSPTRGPVSFRFALREAGPVRADVYDASGRQVAAVLDGPFTAGTHGARWDGRTASGGRAPAGIYYVRLSLPGFTGARRVVMLR